MSDELKLCLCSSLVTCHCSLLESAQAQIPSGSSTETLSPPCKVESSATCQGREAMDVQLKKLNEQVLVITGASSGIGLATARMAAKRGARLVLAARSADALKQLTDEIK